MTIFSYQPVLVIALDFNPIFAGQIWFCGSSDIAIGTFLYTIIFIIFHQSFYIQF